MTSRLAPALLFGALLFAAPGFAHDTKLPVEGAYIDIANPFEPFKVLDFDGAGQAIQRVQDQIRELKLKNPGELPENMQANQRQLMATMMDL